MFRALLPLALVSAATVASAVAPEDEDTPPSPTPTTTTCEDGEVWDDRTNACVAIEQSTLDERTLRRAARELVYADRTGDALALLALSGAPDSSETLTLTAFAHGRSGDYDRALSLYDAALAADPGNLLARAYMGLALIAAGRSDEAAVQLDEIRARGGAGSWPDRALARGIAADAPIGY